MNTINKFVNMKIGPIDIKAKLDSTLGETDPQFTTLKSWVVQFKEYRPQKPYSYQPNVQTLFHFC